MPAEPNPLDGLLVVNKPGRLDPWEMPDNSGNSGKADQPGMPAMPVPSTERLWTSHDVVARVRRFSGQRRIGHTGTLDPMASGVLVLCLGLATRLVEYYQGEDKHYYAEVVLGCATDTYDAEGTVTATAPVPELTPAAIERALEGFRGQVRQAPPAYSAIKQDGKALYARARSGEAVTVEARPVTFHRIELLEYAAPNRLVLAIACSAGAYIRSLAHDLGHSLGTLGTLTVLRREAAGHFRLTDAYTLEQIEAAAAQGALATLLRPSGDGLPIPSVQLSPGLRRRLRHGQRVPLAQATCACDPAQPLVQVYDDAGSLGGIMRCLGPVDDPSISSPAALWKAEKWLS